MHLLVYSQSETFVRGHEMFKIEEFHILTNKIHQLKWNKTYHKTHFTLIFWSRNFTFKF